MNPGSKSFWKNLVGADQIYILDKFFGPNDLSRLLMELEQYVGCHQYNKRIFIISKEQVALNVYKNSKSYPQLPKTDVTISYKLEFLPYVHDRFAVNGQRDLAFWRKIRRHAWDYERLLRAMAG